MLKFQAVTEKTVKDARGLLYFAAPCIYSGVGPLFFIYINDILDIFQPLAKCKLYADDVKSYTELKSSTDEVCCQNYLDLLHEWSEIWQLVISSKKCCVVTIGKLNSSLLYHGLP